MASLQTPHHRGNQPTTAPSAAAAASRHPTSPNQNPSTPFSDTDNSSKSKPTMNPKTAKKPNESEEKLERMINCITAKESEMKHQQLLTRSLSVSLSSSRSGRRIRRRESIYGSQIQIADVFANNGVKVVSADMPPFMQIHAVDCATKAHDSMENFTSKSLALSLKKEFDRVYGPAWHCIVGKNFGSFVTHSVGGFMYFSMPHNLYILLFKTTVQRAN